MAVESSDLDPMRSEGEINVSPRRAQWTRANIDAETQRILDEDAQYFLHQGLSTPCLDVLAGCEGIYIVTRRGRKIMDFHGNSIHQVGFANPRVIEAIKRQLDRQSFSPRRFTNEPAIALARKLTELAPGDLNRVLFAPGGTSVIGMALKLARAATGRFKTVSMWDSFHGASLDAISIGGEAIFRKDIGPLLPGCEHAPPPDPAHCIFDCGQECNLKCADYIEYVLEKEGDVAAVVAETIRSTPFIPPRDYWQRVREACDRHGALLILDEIPSCLGRTGRMFAFEHYGIVPDMVCIGKGLGGGVMPIAALIAREHLSSAHPDRALGHYTHEKNPVACAAALAAIEEIEERGLLEHVRALGEATLERLREMRERHAIIGDVRGLGMQMGVELVKDRETMEKNSDAAERVLYLALTKGLSFKITMGSILTLTPPMIITEDEMNQALRILEECITEVENS